MYYPYLPGVPPWRRSRPAA